ncbi:MFS transporter [Gordonia insulae]|uniref:Putative multidrug resistance protein EmrY n=1 Tax=Gordonia insulae TaxID=2420509 RepID=A0A3G8JR57_9ACTN|nr:MFS transporter [Gordonia insulae]AZG47634.1 putative multidrug resistance protein EmrY [Gordonia insulae]
MTTTPKGDAPATDTVAVDSELTDDNHTGAAIAVVAVLCFGGLVASLMQTLIIPIQPELPTLLDTTISNASWVVTATLLAAAVAMPIAGRLGDMFGKKRIILISSLLLIVGSLVCALSSALIPMIVGRAVQGLAMGFIPLGISLMREVTPPRLTSMAVSAMSATMGVGGAIGLPLAAWVAQQWDWHALFWVSAGLAAIVTALVAFLVPHIDDSTGDERFDIIGAIGLTIGLSGVLIAVSKGNDWGWGSATTLGLLFGGLVVLIVWGVFELRHSTPLVDLRTTARPAVLLTNIGAIAIGFGMMAQTIVVPQLLEIPTAMGGLGQTLLAAGLWMAPGGLMMLVFAPVSGTLINTIGAKFTLAIGATVLGLGYLGAFLLMNAPWQLALASVICSAGVGIGYAAMPTLIMGAVPMTEAGAAVGLNGLMRSIGTTSASAVMALVLTSSTVAYGPADVPSHTAFRWCFLIGAIAAFVGVAITLCIPTARRRSGTNTDEKSPADADPPVAAAASETPEPGFLSVRPRLTGSISAGDGTPLGTAAITVTDIRGNQVGTTAVQTDGTYTVRDIADGTYTVIATAAGHSPGALTVSLVGEAAVRRDFTLAGGSVVRGRVHDADGPLAAHVIVTDQSGAVVAQTQTDPGGHFTISGLSRGDIVAVTASAPGYQPASHLVTVDTAAGRTAEAIEILLVANSGIEGSVRTADGSPIVGATVSAIGRDQTIVASTTTDSAGRYRIDGLTGGLFTMVANMYEPAAVQVKVHAGQRNTADIGLGSGRDPAVS